MEFSDGLIRTMPDAPPNDSGDDSSELEFGSDTADAPNNDFSFFDIQKPSAWDLTAARQHAQPLRPFQTSVDDKIRGALKSIDTHDQPPPDIHEAPSLEKNKSESKTTKKRKRANTTGEDQSSDDDENLDASLLVKDSLRVKKWASKDLQSTEQNDEVKKKGKKRLRKEKSAPTSFMDLHLSRPLQKAVEVLEWSSPTPVQGRAIPYILAGRDVCGSAVTGSGKTGAFVLPILERLLQSGIDNVTRVVILLPTRELAAQCHSVISSLAKYTGIRAALVVGGLSNKTQEVSLRTRPHIIVATPGRLIDHIRNAQSFSLNDIEVLVMDEADRLLEMGFKAEVEEIVKSAPATNRQTLLFSATLTPGLKGLIRLSLHNPINLSVDPMFDVATTLSQEFIKLKPAFEASKDAVLFSLATRTFKTRTIIFFKQKVVAHRFKILFGLTKLNAAELHGNLTQAQRLAALDSFREGTVDFLLCTDLAARGLDISGVETVINYDMPAEVIEYVHRVGRTARAGKQGRACSIVSSSQNQERKVLKDVAKRAKGQLVARVVPPAVIGKWRAWIDNLEAAVKAVLKEEKQEKEMRMAEMELNKADNILKHSDDIYARPARTWFQNEREKKAEQEMARKGRGRHNKTDDVPKRTAKPRKPADVKVVKEKRRRENEEREQGYGKQRAEAKKFKKKGGKR